MRTFQVHIFAEEPEIKASATDLFHGGIHRLSREGVTVNPGRIMDQLGKERQVVTICVDASLPDPLKVVDQIHSELVDLCHELTAPGRARVFVTTLMLIADPLEQESCC